MYKLKFAGISSDWLWWSFLHLLATIMILPVPYALVALNKWTVRNITVENGDKCDFVGTANQVWYWAIPLALLTTFRGSFGQPVLDILSLVALFISYFVMKWFINNITVNNIPVRFTGNKWAWLGWHLLIVLSVITIIGWAWVWVRYMKWVCKNIRSDYGTFEFLGAGDEALWRGVVAVLGSIVIITIPWIAVWLYRWIAENISVYPWPDAEAMHEVAV